MTNRLLVVDSLGLLYRGHFAMSRHPLSAPDGTITSGLYQLVRDILDQMDSLEPSLTIAAMDHPAPSFRRSIYPEYKAHRPPMPEELRSQVDLARELLPVIGIPVVEREGLEADDIVASLSSEACAEGWSTCILSSDKDLLQLVRPGVSVIRPGRPGKRAVTVESDGVCDILGVPPCKVADLLALTGDSSDNIPGARGIGPKTALRLLEDFGTLSAIYEDLDSVSQPSVRRKLEESRDMVMLSRELVSLEPPADLEVSLERLGQLKGDPEKGLEMLSRLGMTRIVGRLELETGPADLFASIPSFETVDDTVSIVRSVENICLPDRLPEDVLISIDTETDSLDPFDASLVGVSLAWSPSDAIYIPFSGPDAVPAEAAAGKLELLLKDRDLCAQNAKFDLHVLTGAGVSLHRFAGDPMIADYLLRPEDRSHSLSTLALNWLGRSMRGYSEVLGARKDLSEVETSSVAAYCGADSRAAWELSVRLRSELEADGRLLELYHRLELPLLDVLASMESRGVALDMETLAELDTGFTERLAELERISGEMLGAPVNLNSPSQVSKALFDTLGLESVRKTPGGGRSSGIDVLRALEGKHPFVELVLEHRELSKLLSTYVRRLPEFLSASDGLLHTNFSQTVTATGRLSSSGPNLQNIPIRTSRGREVRKCFLPQSPGLLFVTADYSQIELRVLAHLAGPGRLREAFARGLDIHSATAEALFGDASPPHRRKAKEVNFSILYGISAWGLSRRLGIGREEASEIIRKYMEEYPELEGYFRDCVAGAIETGETRTILGRRRNFRGIEGVRGSRRAAMERMVVNTTVQGSAADIVKLAMLRVHGMLGERFPGSGLVLQVHDELVATVPEDMAMEASQAIAEEMEQAIDLEVELAVETGTGRNWMEAQH